MNLNALDLNLLLIFEALMDERNVTRAARRVGLSQSAMSNALARLRRTLNDPLLVRTSDGMAPTPAAQALIVPVRAALEQLRAALEERPAFDPSASKRTFHLLTNDYAEMILITLLLRDLRVQASGVGLKIYRPRSVFEAPSHTALADSFDLAIGFYADALTLNAGVRSELLWEEQNVCVASRHHPSIRGKLSLRQYAAAHHVAVFYKAQGPGVIDALLAQKGLARRVTAHVPHFASALVMVAETDLIATVPERLAQRFRRWLKLQVLRVPLDIPTFRMMMLWHERWQADAAHVWLRNQITAAAAGINGV